MSNKYLLKILISCRQIYFGPVSIVFKVIMYISYQKYLYYLCILYILEIEDQIFYYVLKIFAYKVVC